MARITIPWVGADSEVLDSPYMLALKDQGFDVLVITESIPALTFLKDRTYQLILTCLEVVPFVETAGTPVDASLTEIMKLKYPLRERRVCEYFIRQLRQDGANKDTPIIVLGRYTPLEPEADAQLRRAAADLCLRAGATEYVNMHILGHPTADLVQRVQKYLHK